MNPLVNSGAIASVSLVKAKSAQERFAKIHSFFEQLAGAKLGVIEDVYQSEAATNQRNRAHAYILFVSDRIYSDPMEAVDVYTRQCSIGVTAKQLAVMGATLANGGVNPLTQDRVLETKYVPKVLAVMMMAGFYDESGLWAYTAGLPAKTGVGWRDRGGGAWQDGDRRILATRERGRQQCACHEGDRVHQRSARCKRVRQRTLGRTQPPERGRLDRCQPVAYISGPSEFRVGPGDAADCSLPFKGRARVGMGERCGLPIPLPDLPPDQVRGKLLKGEENTATLHGLASSVDPTIV